MNRRPRTYLISALLVAFGLCLFANSFDVQAAQAGQPALLKTKPPTEETKPPPPSGDDDPKPPPPTAPSPTPTPKPAPPEEPPPTKEPPPAEGASPTKPPPPAEPTAGQGDAQGGAGTGTSSVTGESGGTTSSAGSAPIITGQVFADLNADGVQDLGEQGISGVIVELDGEAVGITDADGSFSVPLPGHGKALLSLVAPAGWQWAGEPIIVEEWVTLATISLSVQPAGMEVESHTEAEEEKQPVPAATAVATTAATVTSSVAILVLVGVLAFNGVTSMAQTAAIRAGNRKTVEIGLARLDAMRQQMEQQVEMPKGEEVDWLGRFALEATGEWGGIDQVTRVAARPAPMMVALGRDFSHYVFTTAPPDVARKFEVLGERPRRVPVHPIDAGTSGLTAAREMAAIWTNLAEQEEYGVKAVERVLPRTARWYLYVVPLKKAGDERPWYRRLPKVVVE